jgi:hypothetical protein
MKCPRCGAWTDVAETRRAEAGLVVRRTRVCANAHRFVSYEITSVAYRAAAYHIQRDVGRARARVQRWDLETAALQELRASGDTQRAVAARFGRSAQWIRKTIAARRKLLPAP